MHAVEVYNLKESSILHYLWLDHTVVHCPIFLTAGFKRSLGLVSVPVWLIILSDQLKIDGLVSIYLTNNIIFHKYIRKA